MYPHILICWFILPALIAIGLGFAAWRAGKDDGIYHVSMNGDVTRIGTKSK